MSEATDSVTMLFDNIEEAYTQVVGIARETSDISRRPGEHARSVGLSIREWLEESLPLKGVQRAVWDSFMGDVNWSLVGQHYIDTATEASDE